MKIKLGELVKLPEKIDLYRPDDFHQGIEQGSNNMLAKISNIEFEVDEGKVKYLLTQYATKERMTNGMSTYTGISKVIANNIILIIKEVK